MIPKIVFCPKCKKPIIQKVKFEGEVNVLSGFINFKCGSINIINGKKIPCGGFVKIKTEKQEA